MLNPAVIFVQFVKKRMGNLSVLSVYMGMYSSVILVSRNNLYWSLDIVNLLIIGMEPFAICVASLIKSV